MEIKDGGWKMEDGDPADADNDWSRNPIRNIPMLNDFKTNHWPNPRYSRLIPILALVLGTLGLALILVRHKLLAQEREPQQQLEIKTAIQELKSKNLNELLWVFEEDAEDGYAAKVREELSKSEIKTPDAAEAAALSYELGHGGFGANERVEVVAIIRINQKVADFADEKDLIWIVRIQRWGAYTTQELWISSTTGAVRPVLPPWP